MERTKSIVHNEVRLFGIKIFSSDYTVTEVNETDEYEKVPVPQLPSWRDVSNDIRSKRRERIIFLEKLFNQDNDKNNLGDELS